MPVDLLEAIGSALSALPTSEELRGRIAANLQERQLLRRALRLVKERERAEELRRREATHAR